MSDPNLPPQTDTVPPVAPTPEPTNQPPAAPQEDYEKKFKESSREANLLRERNAVLEREAAERNLTKEPTDSELRTAFPDWDSLTPAEQNLARRTFAAERSALAARNFTEEQKREREWNTSLELAISSNPALEGKEQQFRQYASRPQYRNIPMDVLVSAFLGQAAATPPPPPTPKKPGLEPGNGGPRVPEKPTTISASDLAKLRQSDPKGYLEYIKTHDVSDVDV